MTEPCRCVYPDKCFCKQPRQEPGAKEAFQRSHLDVLVQGIKNREEELGQWLDVYEERFGTQAREEYEERAVS